MTSSLPGRETVILDVFCCEGGASRGYVDAGFRVVGVDIAPQPNYPYEFVQADAVEFVLEHGAKFDAIHASPPCQGETLLQFVNDNRDAHPRLIPATRDALRRVGVPYVIENVIGAELVDPVRLCGEMFGLGVIRHRIFETNWPLTQPAHVPHRGRVRGWRHGTFYDGPYVAVYGEGGGKGTTAEWAEAMGIDWMSRDGLREAIPPAFTRYVGEQMLAHLTEKEVA